MAEVGSPVEQLRIAFAAWEKRGRGWMSFPGAVDLEPVFAPFLWSLVPTYAVDDGRHHTWLSRLVERLTAPPPPEPPALHEPEADIAYPFAWSEGLIELRLILPPRGDISRAGAVSLLRNLSATRLPISFELEGRNGKVTIRFACARSDAAILERVLASLYPSIVVVQESVELGDRFDLPGEFRAIEFGLKREFLVPLALPSGTDPLTTTIGALASAGTDEAGLVQVLFADVRNPWNKVLAQILESDGKDPVLLDRHDARNAAGKASAPLYAAVLRVGAISPSEDGAWGIIRRIASTLGQFDTPDGNGFIPLGTDDEEVLEAAIFDRVSYRTGMLLSLDEIAALVHLPTDVSSFLARERVGLKRPPEVVLSGDGVALGVSRVRGDVLPVHLPERIRSRHVHVIGATGTGKSTLLLSLMTDDIARGNGVALIDPHGDLADELLSRIPIHRRNDVILFDPSEPDFVIGWNLLAASTDSERDILADDFVGIFRRLSTSWGDQMTAVLSNAVLAFLYSKRGGTLIDLRQFLVDASFRTEFLKTVEDDRTRGFWKEEFPLLVGKRPQAPILTRLDTFLRSRIIRRIVSEMKAQIDFADVVDHGRIVVGKLAQGAIGAENAALLGSLLVSKFHQATLSRYGQIGRNRRPFYLYLDEFHLLATPSMEALFTGARKFGLSLTVAHQNVAQLQKKAPEVADAVLSEAYTRIAFRLGTDDARVLAKNFASFTPEDLSNLDVGQAICRVGRSEDDFLLETSPLAALDEETAEAHRDSLRRESLSRWARSVEEPAHSEEPEPAPEPPPPAPRSPEEAPSRISLRPSLPNDPRPPEPPAKERTPGRGGAEHKYLQELIRAQAHAKGYIVTLEEVLPDGGRVDVALRRGGTSIAVEIALTLNLDHEVENVRKCLAAGFGLVAAVSLDGRFLARLGKRLAAVLSEGDRSRVKVQKPEEFLEILATEEPPPTTVRGYTVRVVTPGTDHEDVRRRQRVIAELIARKAQRLKEE
jgi:hypothetical protein